MHLAAASELVGELGPIPGVPDDVRARAAGWLAKAAKRAYMHDMAGTALRLSDRALSFLDPDDEETARSAPPSPHLAGVVEVGAA